MDVSAAAMYWRYKNIWCDGHAIFISSVFFLCLGGIGFIGHIILVILRRDWGISKWINRVKKGREVHKMFEVVVQSLPPLWIALFVLATKNNLSEFERLFLYVYSALSCLNICATLQIFANAFEVFMQIPLTKRTSWHSVMLYLSKFVIIIVRVLILVYMTVQIGWWVALALSVHVLFFTVVAFYHLYLTSDKWWQNFINLAISSLSGFFSVFSWFGTDKDEFIKDFIIGIFYTLENASGLLVSWFQDPKIDYYLHGYVLPIYFSLDALALLLLLSIIIIRKCKSARSSPAATIH